MESIARKRLDCISRHFSLPCKLTDVLEPALVSNGQLRNLEIEPVIIGGMVLDIHATPSLPPNPRTTTPGKVNYVVGGVARNVAECMSKLGTKPFMISVSGQDMAGNLLLEHWKAAKLSTQGILKQQHIKTAVVINVFDDNGEVTVGVASVEAIEKFLTPEWIRRFKNIIHSAPVLMVDANLNLPALEESCQMAVASNIPVWFEPVSVTKSRRIVSIAKYVSFASPNETELIAMANALTGKDVFSYPPSNKSSVGSLFQMLKPAIWVLLENGIKTLIVTLGPDGVFLCSKGGPESMKTNHQKIKCSFSCGGMLYEAVSATCKLNRVSNAANPESGSSLFAIHFPALPATVVRLTGAGDCLVGGTLSSICAGLNVIQSVAVGIAASKAAVEAEANVPHSFDLATIADDARLVYNGAKVVCHEPMP